VDDTGRIVREVNPFSAERPNEGAVYSVLRASLIVGMRCRVDGALAKLLAHVLGALGGSGMGLPFGGKYNFSCSRARVFMHFFCTVTFFKERAVRLFYQIQGHENDKPRRSTLKLIENGYSLPGMILLWHRLGSMKTIRSVTSLAVFFLLAAFWYQSIQLNWDPNVVDGEVGEPPYLGADVHKYSSYFRDFPATIDEIKSASSISTLAKEKVFVELWKKPLWGPVSAVLSLGASELFRLALPNRMFVVLALYGSACTYLLFALLRSAGVRWEWATLISAIATVSFGWLSMFSIVETASLSTVGALIAMWSGANLSMGRNAPKNLLLHCLLTGCMAWLHLTICGAVLFILRSIDQRRQVFTILLPCIALVCFVALLPQFFGHTSYPADRRMQGGIDFQISYAAMYGNLANWFEVKYWLDATFAFLAFILVSPINHFASSPGTVQWDVVFSRPAALGASLLVITAYVSGGLVFWRRASFAMRKALAVPLLWLVLLIIFYVFFNPREVLVYLPIPLAIVLYAVGIGLSEVKKKEQPWITAMLLFMLMTCALLNFPAVFG
jgi:hypothetical protein